MPVNISTFLSTLAMIKYPKHQENVLKIIPKTATRKNGTTASNSFENKILIINGAKTIHIAANPPITNNEKLSCFVISVCKFSLKFNNFTILGKYPVDIAINNNAT